MAEKTDEELKFDEMFTEYLCRLRESLNLNKTQMANQAGMSRQVYSNLESETRTPSLFSVFRVLENLDMRPGDFFNELFDAYKAEKRKVQVLADQTKAREDYQKACRRKALSED